MKKLMAQVSQQRGLVSGRFNVYATALSGRAPEVTHICHWSARLTADAFQERFKAVAAGER